MATSMNLVVEYFLCTACRLALAEAPARCDGDWFEAWRRPLADLCAGHGARGSCCH